MGSMHQDAIMLTVVVGASIVTRAHSRMNVSYLEAGKFVNKRLSTRKSYRTKMNDEKKG